MEGFPSYFYDVNLFSITLRLVLAVLFGGIIGLERGAHKHAAGFRTHILVCVGATLAMLTNQYIFEYMSNLSDPSRMGAQVITGVGFLGVGTILVTGDQKIRGLTTAAGLWASACTGLALGIGFYAGSIIAGILIIISLSLLPRVETAFYNSSRTLSLFIELESITMVKGFLAFVELQEFKIYETHLSKSESVASGGIGFHMSVRIPKGMRHAEVLQKLSAQEGVYLVEEL